VGLNQAINFHLGCTIINDYPLGTGTSWEQKKEVDGPPLQGTDLGAPPGKSCPRRTQTFLPS
jgi:hypothetical protein